MNVIDLTHPIDSALRVYFPWHPATSLERTANFSEHRCEVTRLSIGTHTGTHIDAPSHVFQGMPTIDQYDPALWYSHAMVLDFSPRESRRAITKEELQQKFNVQQSGVVLKTGWDKFFGREDYYQTYPPLSPEAAEYLAALGTTVVAADTPFTLETHYILLKQGIPLITNLNNTAHLHEGRITLVAAPLLIKGADGAPARVFAIEEE
ncbi:MAG: cyclase family protein [bacterium]